MVKKIFVLITTLVIILSTILIPTKVEIIRGAGGGGGEIELDYDWIYDIVVNLSSIVHNITTNDIHMGRDFGSLGEQKAAEYIYNWMDENTKNLNKSIHKYPVGDDSYTGEDYKVIKRANDKMDIISYGLTFTNGTVNATIKNNESFPVPRLIIKKNGIVNVTSKWLGSLNQKVVLMDEDDISNESTFNVETSYVMLDATSQIASGFAGEVVLIEDYYAASENETAEKIHFLEFETNECDDTYIDKIQNVINSNGSGFIFVATNPSFIKDLSISAFGVAVSPKEGRLIKNYILDNKTVLASFGNDSLLSENGSFRISPLGGILGDKKIGLIHEHSDKPVYKNEAPWTTMGKLCAKPRATSDYVGFLLFNKTYDNTHYMLTSSGFPWQSQNIEATMFSPYAFKPFMYINGTINLDNGESLNIWDWAANDTNLQARFWIEEERNYSAESYNVVCDVEGKNQSKSIMISGGHHDFFWGQGASDNAVGVATMLGILKYLNESNITPEYNLTFVSFGGEERIDRGSGVYVFNESFKSKNENMTYMLNMDWFAFNTPDTKLFVTATNESFSKALLNVTARTFYNETFVGDGNYKLYVHHGPVSNDALPFYGRYVNSESKIYEEGANPDLQLVEIGKEHVYNNARHRSGMDHENGDALWLIDRKDLNYTADIVLNITKYLAWEPSENEFGNCSFTLFDRGGNGWNDSVNIAFNATTNFTSWARVEACLYNVSTGSPVSDVNITGFTVYKNRNTSDYLSVTLYSTMKNDTYNASIRIYDDHDNVDDECYQLVNLTPYEKPTARFSYEKVCIKEYNFYDESLPSPGATIQSWNWSFGDGTYFNTTNPSLANTSHTYADKGSYDVTLTIWDSNNLTDNETKTLEVENSVPYVSFSANNSVVCVGQSIQFTSASNDCDGSITNSTWDFGDGTYAYTTNATHSYDESGIYTVALSVMDDDNATNTTSKMDYLIIADALVNDEFTDDPSNHKWDSIQKGINDVGNDSIVYVYNGIYQWYLVNKSVSIYGESKELVLVLPQPIGIDVQCHDVYIKNCTIDGGLTGVNIISTANGTGNTTIENVVIHGPITYGVYVDNSTNNTIKGCTIEKADVGVKICNGAEYNVIDDCNISWCYHGVGVYSSSCNWIGNPSINEWYPNDCVFKLNTNAVYIDESDNNYVLGCDIDASSSPTGPPVTTRGIYLDESSKTTISTCNIFKGTQGIYIKDSWDNKVEFCRIIENSYGIEWVGADAEDNLIVQNNITNNSQYGVYLPSFPKSNKVFYNDFLNNGNGSTNQSYDSQTEMSETNKWFKQGPNTLQKKDRGEGNYWNDYTGLDLDSDGIGDTEYGVDGDGEDDDCPLMEAYGWCTGTGW